MSGWAGEDWLIIGGFTVLVIALAALIWFGTWITGDKHRRSAAPDDAMRHTADEHEALGIGAITHTESE